MGTRGLMVIKCDNKLHNFYNGYDSYPDGLGYDLLSEINYFLFDDYEAGIGCLKQKTRNLIPINPDIPPTPQQIKWCEEYLNLSVSSQSNDDWYCLLRETQGSIKNSLDARFYHDRADFAEDNLFCEWSYIIDLDKEEFRAYNDGYITGNLFWTINLKDIPNLGLDFCQAALNIATQALSKELYGDDG